MRQASPSKRHPVAFDTTFVGARACAFLRRLYPARTVDNVVADLSGWSVKPATIAKMLERQTAPGTVLWAALTCTYGPEFLAAVLPHAPAWLDAAHRAQRQEAFEHRLADLRRDFEDLR